MNTYKEKIEIAVVAPPFSGHLYPALELVLPLLKEKDKYNICIYTGCQKEEVVKKLGFPVKVFLEISLLSLKKYLILINKPIFGLSISNLKKIWDLCQK